MEHNIKLLRATVMGKLDIHAAASDHPNELKFKGVLVLTSVPSTKAPNGSRGHKILIPTALAAAKLKTLIGMGVNYSPDLDKHAPTNKVGVIKKAWMDGNKVCCSGVIWKKDFPEAEKKLKQKDLGMSFEASDIDVEDMNATVWTLSNLCFTGAAILYKASAAYYKTEALAASAEMSVQLIKTKDGGREMPQPNKKKKVAIAASGLTADQLVAALTKVQKPLLDAINANSAGQLRLQQTIEASQVASLASKADDALEAGDDDEDEDIAASEDEDDVDASEEVVAAKGKKKPSDDTDDNDDEDEDDDMDSSADDDDELEDLDTENTDEDTSPGHLNSKITKNKGNKTTVSTKNDKHKTVAASGLARLSRKVDALIEASSAKDEEIKILRRQLKATKTQIEAAGARTDRKSVGSLQLQSLLAKEGVDTSMYASGEDKMSVAEFDAILDKGNVPTQSRIAMKSEACRVGVLDEGVVRRS